MNPRPLSIAAVPLPAPVAVAPFERLLFVVIAAGVLLRIWFVFSAPVPAVIFRLTDDAFYYFNVARHVVHGDGLTFDGLNQTNGFHPLWMSVVTLLYAPVAGAAEDGLRIVSALLAVLAGATLLTGYAVLRRIADPRLALVGTLALLAPPTINGMFNGLETALLLPLLFLLIRLLTADNFLEVHRGPWSDVAVGGVLALVFLCRLDTVFIVAAVVLAIPARSFLGLSRAPVTPVAVRTLLVALPPLVAFVAYGFLNLWHFGALQPISSQVKSTFPVIEWDPGRLLQLHRAFGLVQIVTSSIMLVWLDRERRRSGEFPREQSASAFLAAKVLWCGCLTHYLYTLLFMDWAVHWWHFISYSPVCLVLLVLFLDRYRARHALVVPFASMLVPAGVVLAVAGDLWLRGSHHQPLYEAALAARERLPRDAVVGMLDSGVFGYFSGRPTINLDGVINGRAYQEALRDGRLRDYLDAVGVSHIADYQVRYDDGRFVMRLKARMFQHEGGAIVATPEAEIYRSEVYDSNWLKPELTHVAIWERSRLLVLDDAHDVERLDRTAPRRRSD